MIEPNDTDQVHEIKMTDILADPELNCRGPIAYDSVIGLAEEIAEQGLQSPVCVRPNPLHTPPFLLVYGFRRYTAHRLNKAETIKAFIRPMSKSEALLTNFIENMQREDLNVAQEANAIAKLMRIGMTPMDIAEKLKTTVAWVRVRVCLNKLEPEIQELAGMGLISIANITDLYAIKDTDERMAAAKFMREKSEAGYTGRIKIKTDVERSLKRKKHGGIIKKARTSDEVKNLLFYLQSIGFPFGTATRFLAWAAGEITDDEVIYEIEKVCLEENIEFQRPFNGVPDMSEIPLDC